MRIPKTKELVTDIHELGRAVGKIKMSENQRYTMNRELNAFKSSIRSITRVASEGEVTVTIGPRVTTVQKMQETHDAPIAPPPRQITRQHLTEKNPDAEVELPENDPVDSFAVVPGR